MGRWRQYFCSELIPFAAMVTVECTNVGLNTIYKAAVSKGLNYHVFMVYSYAISALVLLPLSYIFHRKTPLPPLDVIQLAKFFILGALTFVSQYLGYKGIAYSSPTMGSAMSNLSPATTFILAILFRMEKLRIRSFSSQAKIVGTLVSIGGAIVVVFYKGPILINLHKDSLKSPISILTILLGATPALSDWIKGGILLAASYLITSVWYIFQGIFVKEYPAELVVVFFVNFFACVVSAPLCLFLEPNFATWKVPADVRLLSIISSGIMGSAFGFLVHTWGIHVKGPFYVALFRPLSIAIAAILGVIFLGENLYLGSVIGSTIISMGFYTVLWGKKQEEETSTLPDAPPGDAIDVPLLKEYPIPTKENAVA